MKIVKSLEESCLIIKDDSETIKMIWKNKKNGFLERLLDTLGYSLLGNLLTVKDTIRGGECTTTADQDI